MDRYCIVDSASNTVQNIIVWDGDTDYTPPVGTFLVPATDEVSIGWVYDSTNKTYLALEPVTQTLSTS